MNLRQKILLLFSLTIVLAVAAVAWTVSLRVRSLFETLDRDRTAALVTQFLREYQRRADDVTQRVDLLARDERVTRIAYDLAHNGDPAPYLTQAGTFAQELQLDFLELVAADGSIVSSAQSPARFGYREPAIASPGNSAFLKEEQLDPQQSQTGLFALRALPDPESGTPLYLLAGQRLDSAFLANLSTPAGTFVSLYRNASPSFNSANIIFPGTSAPSLPAAYAQVVEQARTSAAQTPSVTTHDPTGDSLNLTGIPLKSASGQVAAVLVIANSRRELVDAQQHIRTSAYGVAALGILFAILTSLWIAASVSRPIEQLAQASRQVAAGDWTIQVPVPSPRPVPRRQDELGQLARAFNHMTRELLTQRERLVQSERVAAWRELARRLAHELKNPLFPLQLTVENMVRAKAVSPEVFEEVFAEGVSTLSGEIANLKAIIGRFSDFSKMPKPELAQVDLRDTLTRVTRLFAPTLAQRTHPIHIVVELPETPLPAALDPELMHRAVSNLVLNAIDAMPEGGTLTLTAALTDQHASTLHIAIADTGQGMTPEECARLFTPYYTTRQQGTGLGLAIVQSVIADHHGSITVQSHPNRGTTFLIHLPTHPPPLSS